MKIYLLISLFSYLFRTFILGQFFNFGGIILLVDLIAPGVTFFMVGVIYPSGWDKSLGSTMYFLLFVLNYSIGNVLLGTWLVIFKLISLVVYMFVVSVFYYIFGEVIRKG